MPGKPGFRHTKPIPFDLIVPYLLAVIANLGNSAFTWSPKSNRQYDIKKPAQTLALFLELVEGGLNFDPDLPIYLIAVTCNTSITINLILRRAYEKLMSITNQPLIGYWISKTGIKYLDVVLATQVINKAEAVRLAKKYGQDYIIRIYPSGKSTTIQIR